MLSRVVLWFLFVSFSPVGPELVEWAAHYAQDGDFADLPDAGHRRSPADQEEHGCAVFCHSCGCHGSTGTVRELSRDERSPDAPRRLGWPHVKMFADLPAPQPGTPPPIA